MGESRSVTVGPIQITCDCATGDIDLDTDPMHVRRGQWVEWVCSGDGDRFGVEFDPNGPIVPPKDLKDCGATITGFVRPGAVLGTHKYSVHVFCGDDIHSQDPDLIVDD